MIKVKGYSSYFGGKSGNGTYQNLINHIPPHDVFYSLFLGHCGVTRHIKPAAMNYLNDLDVRIIQAWNESGLPGNQYVFTNEPALIILKELAGRSPDGKFIYLDPPYRKSSRKSQADVYRHEMTDLDHTDLLSQIVAMPAHKIMISHYPDPMYDEALKGWYTHDFYSMIRNGLVLERIYYNYELRGKLHDYSFIGNDFREREALGRIKRNFIRKLNALSPQLRESIFQDLIAQYSDVFRKGYHIDEKCDMFHIDEKCDAIYSHKNAVLEPVVSPGESFVTLNLK